jgi:plastocyanin
MHTAAIHLAPVLAAEKSRTVFYILAGLLVVWALTVSLFLGLRMPNFPSSVGGQRIVTAISAVLVLATVSSGVITSGTASKASASAPSSTSAAPGPSNATASRSLSLEANAQGQLAYNTKQLSAKAGAVTITMTNMSPLMHNVTVAQGSKVLGATPTFQGGSRTLTLNLKPGTYTFYCSVPGHRQAGMEGKLTVS